MGKGYGIRRQRPALYLWRVPCTTRFIIIMLPNSVRRDMLRSSHPDEQIATPRIAWTTQVVPLAIASPVIELTRTAFALHSMELVHPRRRPIG